MGRGSQQDLALAANSHQEGGRDLVGVGCGEAGRQRATAATAAGHALPHQMQIIDMVPVRKWEDEEESNERKNETISHQLFDSQPQL